MTEAIKALPASPGVDDEVVFDWPASNDAVLGAGLRWIDVRLQGEDGVEARAQYQAARTAMEALGQPASIDRIANAFNLSPFDEDVLLLALAPMIDGSFGPRYGALQGRLSAAPATPHTLSILLFGSDRLPRDAMACLASSAPLRRYRLIQFDESAELTIAASITVSERIRGLLSGVNEPEARLEGVARTLHPVALPERLEALATRIARAGDGAPRLQLIGAPRSGRRALGATIMARLGYSATIADGAALTAETSAMLIRDAALDGAGLIIETDQPSASLTLRSLELDWQGPLLVVAEQPLEGFEVLPVIRIDPIAPDERASLWLYAAPGLDRDEVAKLAEQFALGPSEVEALANHSGLAARGAWAVCRDLGARDLEALATRIAPRRALADMVLAVETRTELEALAAQVDGRAQVHGQWGYRAVLGRATGVSALFAGPSGVGKTMAAEAIAHALELDLYVVDLARVTSKYIGETEKNLRRIFDAAEGGGAVLFFDEADALFGKRSEVKDSHDRYANAEISYLLQRMESYGGLAILATNLKAHLDTAFLRRLRMIVDFPLPDVEARLALWRRALPETAPQGTIDWQRLARIELTGGNITTIGTNAAFRAAAAGEPIDMTHLAAAIAAEFRKLDREPAGLAGP